jgi:hypothetical protein
VKQITLAPPFYGQYQNRLVNEAKQRIFDSISELEAKVVKMEPDKRGRIKVSVEGTDAEFVVNFLAKEFGSVPDFNEVVPGNEFLGRLVDVGKVGYGLYVDIGIVEPRFIDVLVPLHRLREQVEMPMASVRKIAASLLFVEDLPVEVVVTEMDRENGKVGAEFSPGFLERFKSWCNDDHERLVVFGANYQMVESTLEKTGHSEDIYQVEQLGLLEFSLRCKRSTRASGILAAIGPRMKGIAMHPFIPKEIEAKWHAKA